jgi:hypothetical protein
MKLRDPNRLTHGTYKERKRGRKGKERIDKVKDGR